jgi:hypothetical protein
MNVSNCHNYGKRPLEKPRYKGDVKSKIDVQQIRFLVWTSVVLLILCIVAGFYERGSGSSGTVKARSLAAERLWGSEAGLNFTVKGNRK